MGGVDRTGDHRADRVVHPGLGSADRAGAAVSALGTAGEGAPRELLPTQLEVAVLDRTVAGRTFRRVQGAALAALLTPPAVARTTSLTK